MHWATICNEHESTLRDDSHLVKELCKLEYHRHSYDKQHYCHKRKGHTRKLLVLYGWGSKLAEDWGTKSLNQEQKRWLGESRAVIRQWGTGEVGVGVWKSGDREQRRCQGTEEHTQETNFLEENSEFHLGQVNFPSNDQEIFVWT